jgi:WD40 repeat protein
MDQPARLWPMHDRDGSSRDLQPACGCWGLAFDPSGTNVLVGTANDRQQGRPDGRVLLYPIAGGPPRLLPTGWEGESGVGLVAFDRPGRRAVAIQAYGTPRLRVWDVASGAGRTYPLEQLTELQASTIIEAVFAPDGSLLVSSGDVVHRLVIPEDPGGKVTAERLFTAKGRTRIALGPDGRTLLVLAAQDPNYRMVEFEKLVILDLETGVSREVTTHGRRLSTAVLDPTGTLIISGDHEGVVRVGPISGEEPHLLLGANLMVESLAVSPDGRWVAAAASEEISLWPMPDLAKDPLHTQPLPQLLATLNSFTNQRVVADPSSATGWKLDLAPFPGWKDVPGW